MASSVQKTQWIVSNAVLSDIMPTYTHQTRGSKMTNSVIPTNLHIDATDNDLIKFSHTIRSDKNPITIRCKPNPSYFGYCYWAVEKEVMDNGGSAVYGWLFTKWPGSHIEAMHHAIYKAPDGSLVDICPKLPGHDNPYVTTFLEDDSIKIDLDRVPAIKNKFYQLNSNIFTRNFISSYEKKNTLVSKHSQLSYDLGYRCEGQRDLVRGRQPNIDSGLADRLQGKESNDLGYRVQLADVQLGKNIEALKSHIRNSRLE